MNHTNEALANAFIQLLEEKAVSKITVKDIVDRCGVNRNTFYYHFRDIPDLCEFIWRTHIDTLISSHCAPGSPSEAVSVAVRFFTRHRNAVLHVYRSLPRDTFQTYLNQLANYLVVSYLDTVAADFPLPPQRKSMVIRYYRCVLVGIFLDWLDCGMSYDLLDMAALIRDLRTDSGQKWLEQLTI